MAKEVKWCFAGAKVGKWMKENGVTRAKFADRLGVTEMSLWRWMVGKAVPPLEYAVKIQDITDVSVKYWLV